jgi:hypothetical protein
MSAVAPTANKLSRQCNTSLRARSCRRLPVLPDLVALRVSVGQRKFSKVRRQQTLSKALYTKWRFRVLHIADAQLQPIKRLPMGRAQRDRSDLANIGTQRVSSFGATSAWQLARSRRISYVISPEQIVAVRLESQVIIYVRRYMVLPSFIVSSTRIELIFFVICAWMITVRRSGRPGNCAIMFLFSSPAEKPAPVGAGLHPSYFVPIGITTWYRASNVSSRPN